MSFSRSWRVSAIRAVGQSTPGIAAVASCAGRRLARYDQLRARKLMERTAVLDMISGLELYGMRSAYDETLATAIKRKHVRSASSAIS